MCTWTKNGGEKTRMPMVISTATSTIGVFSASTKFLQNTTPTVFIKNTSQWAEIYCIPEKTWAPLKYFNRKVKALSWIVDHALLKMVSLTIWADVWMLLVELSADFRPDLPDLRLPWAQLLATFIHWSEVKQCICWPWMELSQYLSLSWLIAKKRITPIYTPYKPQKDRRHMVLPVLYFFSAPRSIVSSAWSHYQVGHGWCLTFLRIRWATCAVL